MFFLECTKGNLEFRLKRGKGPDRMTITELLVMVLEHRTALLEEWNAINQREEDR